MLENFRNFQELVIILRKNFEGNFYIQFVVNKVVCIGFVGFISKQGDNMGRLE